MTGRALVWVLLVLNALSLGSVILIPILAEGGALDSMPLLKLPFLPFMMTWPLGPPLLLMVLFGFLGSSRHIAKVSARVVAALLSYVPLAFIMMGYAFSGRFVVEPTDGAIGAPCLAIAALLAWFGFKPDEAAAETHCETAHEPE